MARWAVVVYEIITSKTNYPVTLSLKTQLPRLCVQPQLLLEGKGGVISCEDIDNRTWRGGVEGVRRLTAAPYSRTSEVV